MNASVMGEVDLIEGVLEDIQDMRNRQYRKTAHEISSSRSHDVRARLYKQLDSLLDIDYCPSSYTALKIGNKLFFLVQLTLFRKLA